MTWMVKQYEPCMETGCGKIRGDGSDYCPHHLLLKTSEADERSRRAKQTSEADERSVQRRLVSTKLSPGNFSRHLRFVRKTQASTEETEDQ